MLHGVGSLTHITLAEGERHAIVQFLFNAGDNDLPFRRVFQLAIASQNILDGAFGELTVEGKPRIRGFLCQLPRGFTDRGALWAGQTRPERRCQRCRKKQTYQDRPTTFA